MLNYYTSFYSTKQQRWAPGIKARTLTQERFYDIVRDAFTATLIREYRAGDKEAKSKLPAVCWTGTLAEGATRKAEAMQPTGMYMIDIDHCDHPAEAWENIQRTMRETNYDYKLMVAHITPSGKGLRMVFKCTENFPTLTEHMDWVRRALDLDVYGDFDTAVHDVSRISFMPCFDDILYIDNKVFDAPFTDFQPIINEKENDDNQVSTHAAQEPQGTAGAGNDKGGTQYRPLHSEYADYTYHGHKMVDIIARYIAEYGEPEVGERHNFYNKMVLDFRNICGNSPSVLVDLLPRYDGDDAAAYAGYLSQCQSICRKNTNSRIPKDFYAFLAKNGFYKKNTGKQHLDDDDTDPETENDTQGGGTPTQRPAAPMPQLPPVIRELVSIAPDDFKVPAINALLPILGTLTSYVRTEDKSNAKELSTSFFSIIYAPPSSGKSFVERYINMLLRDIMLRDEVNDARDAIFARSQQRKSANDRSEAVPQTSIRIMEAKNSEAEFLEKQRNNAGHHMFTYCSEIDQWRKGIRAAGGNKDDMVRIAWDNGRYGQNFKSANTFKGKVQLFWNVLIAGTSDQLAAYFKNVTNGLVTRCSFAEIENQQFQSKIPQWGKLSAKDMRVIDAFITRCDEKTYTEPLGYDPQQCYTVSDEDFDKEVPWHFTFRPFERVSIDWITRTIERFNEAQCNRARIDSDEARDTFRRRVAERGKRLALLCTQLYARPMTKQDKELCKRFVTWWMEQDIEGILKPFGKRYVEATQEAVSDTMPQKTLFQRMPDEFDKQEVRRVADILGYKTAARKIISRWVTAGVVEKFAENKWRKLSDALLRLQGKKGGAK